MIDHYQLLGVAPTASAAEIRQAYARLARERHPDRFTDPAEKQRAQTALQDITTAFNALVNPRTPPGVRRVAPQAAVPGRPRRSRATPSSGRSRSSRGGSSRRRSRCCARRCTTRPTRPPTTPRSGAPSRGSRALAREAVQALERATQLAPQSASAFADLAAVLARQGLRLRAQKAMETALRLAPRDARLARLAAELGLGQP